MTTEMKVLGADTTGNVKPGFIRPKLAKLGKKANENKMLILLALMLLHAPQLGDSREKASSNTTSSSSWTQVIRDGFRSTKKYLGDKTSQVKDKAQDIVHDQIKDSDQDVKWARNKGLIDWHHKSNKERTETFVDDFTDMSSNILAEFNSVENISGLIDEIQLMKAMGQTGQEFKAKNRTLDRKLDKLALAIDKQFAILKKEEQKYLSGLIKGLLVKKSKNTLSDQEMVMLKSMQVVTAKTYAQKRQFLIQVFLDPAAKLFLNIGSTYMNMKSMKESIDLAK